MNKKLPIVALPLKILKFLFNLRTEYKSALILELGAICLSLVMGSLMAYLLSVEDRGNLQYYAVLAALIIGPLSFGIPFSNCYFEMKQKSMVKDAVFFPVYLSLVLVASYVVGQAISDIEVGDLIYFSLTSAGYFYVNERCKSTSRLSLFSWFQFIRPLLALIFILVALLYFSSGLRVFLYVLSTSTLVSTIALLYLDKASIFKPVKQASPVDIKYLLGYWLALLSSSAVNNMDKLFIAYYLSKADLGIYAVLLTTTVVMTKLCGRISISYFVITTGERIAKLRLRAVKLVLATFVPCAILGWGIGKILVPIVFSAKYAGYELITALVFVSALLANTSWILAQQFNSSGRPHLNIIRVLLSLVIFVVLVLSEVFGSGLLAVSLAVLCASLFRFLYSVLFTI